MGRSTERMQSAGRGVRCVAHGSAVRCLVCARGRDRERKERRCQSEDAGYEGKEEMSAAGSVREGDGSTIQPVAATVQR